jgi:O-antigen ligase
LTHAPFVPDTKVLHPLWVGAALLAVVPSAMLAVNLPPSATFLNQVAAMGGWGLLCAVLSAGVWPPMADAQGRASHAALPVLSPGLLALLSALVLLMLAGYGSHLVNDLPMSLALSAVAFLAAAALVAAVGAATMASGGGGAAFTALCVALVVAGVLSVVVGTVQVLAPELADGQWIAVTTLEGRASGNMRQPNHLSSLLLWSFIAALWLADSPALASGAAPHAARSTAVSLRSVLLRTALQACALAFIFGLVLSASRTGMLGVLALAVWGALDRSLSRRTRVLLVASPVLYALSWLGLSTWAQASGHVFGGAARLRTETDISSSRFGIWSNTLSLIAQHPWAGVGWGEFNRVWSTTPFPGRPVAFFDHTHNLLLQFVVELGLPLATLVLSLLTWALWRAWPVGAAAAGDGRSLPLLRSAWMMVLLVAWHSLLEYPLWYAYFLLPAAFAWGLCLGAGQRPGERPAVARAPSPRAAAAASSASASAQIGTRAPAWPLLIASALLCAGSAASVFDYLRVTEIFEPGNSAVPLAERIAIGQRSVLFSHHADYAAATTATSPDAALGAIEGAKHFLLDTRLMIAWSRALAASGNIEGAQYIAARLREFRNAGAKDFFAPCLEPHAADTPRPYQCAAPDKELTEEDFR